MKRLLSTGLLLVIVMLMTAVGFADQKIDPDANCEVCLKTSANGSLDVNWSAETVDAVSLRDETMAYHDGSFEGQIGCGGGCGFSVRFTADAPLMLTGLTVFTQGDAAATAAIVSIYTDPAGALAGPPSMPIGPGDGTALWESAAMDMSTPDGSLQQFDLVLDNLVIDGGDYYVVVWENSSGFMGVSNDLQPNNIDRNWVYTDAGWMTIDATVAGDPTLTGNLGVTSTYIFQDIEGSYMTIGPSDIDFGVVQLDDSPFSQDVTISNLGNTDFSISAIGVEGLDFSTSLTAPVTVTAGTSVVMDVVFAPTTEGAAAGTFTITSDAENMTEAVVTASGMVFDGFPEYMVWNPSASISGQAFVDGIEALGHTAHTTTDLFMFGNPVDAGYLGIFVTLGMYPDNYVLLDGTAEVTALVEYALAGSPLYMEGGDTWAANTPTALHGFFGIDGTADGGDDLATIEGESLLADLDYVYAGINNDVDHLAPNYADAMVFHVNPADGEPCGIGNLSPGANTIGNSFEFGGLVDGESLVADLLAEYLTFLAMPYTDLWPPSISAVTQFAYTLDTDGPYSIEAFITDNVGTDFAVLYYNINGGEFSTVTMTDAGEGLYTGDIPGQVVGSTVGYYVMAVDEEGNEGFAPEAAPTALYVFDVVSHLPPTFVEAISGLDGQVDLTWLAPGTEAPPLLECADIAVDVLPFNDSGTNLGMGDDFDVTFSDGEDVAYQLNVGAGGGTYTISLCNSSDFDTKLEVFMEDCLTSTGYYNDDACGLQSELTGVFLEAGTYLIVVDGFSGATGNYTIDVSEETFRAPAETFASDVRYEASKLQDAGFLVTREILSSSPREFASVRELRELINYGIYRSTSSPVLIEAGNQIEVVAMDPTAYSDSPLANGIDYYYRISAIYDDGEAAAAEVVATPINHIPSPVLGLQGVVDDMTVTLDWNDNTDYDFDHYNVYRDGALIGGASVSDYVDVLTVGGIYEYAITAVDAEDAESEMSDDVTMLVGNLPPMRLTAESGLDGTVNLEWAAPGDLLPGLLDCADELITELPFVSTGTNLGMGDNFDVSGSDGEDYVYQLWMPEDGIVNITLCDASTDFDTKMEIFNEDCFTTTGYYNDDLTCEFSNLQSTIEGAFLAEGLYLVVVDGYGGGTGNYGITVTEAAARSEYVAVDPSIEIAKLAADGIVLEAWEMSSAPQRTVNHRVQTGFQVFRDGNEVGPELAIETLTYVDQYIPNGIEYCYTVEAVYDDGNSASNEACATPLNWNPLAPQNLTFTIDDHDITLAWDANTDYDLASYNVYREGELVLNTTAIDFAENLPLSNIYHYFVTAVDAEGAESAPSNGVVLPVGNLPPAVANAQSGLDGGVQLSWMPPGTIGSDGLFQDFESGIFPPADWSQMQTNPATTWQLYDDNYYEGLYSGGVWWDFEHQDEWLYTPEFTIGAGDELNFWSYAQQGSEYGDHYYVKVSADGGSTWDIVLDMSTLPIFDNPDNSNFNDWQVPYSVDMSAYAGQSVQIAFHGIDVNDVADPNYPGLWWVWLVDAITVGPAEGAATFAASTGLWGTYPENTARELSAQPFQTGEVAAFESVFINSPVREMRSQISEYQIYRSLTSPVQINETDLLVTLDTLILEYWDFEPLTNGTDYYYVIAANYPDDTEISLSPELMGTPMNHAPAAPMGLVGAGDEDANVTLDWDDNTEYDFASYNVYRDDAFVLNVLTSTFTEVAAEAGVYEYAITAVDAEDAESLLSEGVDVATGPLPPERLHAESGMDGQVNLTWAAPGDVASIFTVEVMTDDYPGETSWDLYNEDGELFANSGVLTETVTLHTWEFELPPGVYTWTIYDSYGDGICCTYGEGYYNLNVNGINMANGGDFGTDESWTFDGSGIVTARTTSHFVGTPIGSKGEMPLNYAQLAQVTENLEIPVYQSNNAERSFDGFQVFRDGIAVSDVLSIDTYSYLDGWNVDEDLDNGTEYCYTVSAVYTSATTLSNQACATPLNHIPSVPLNVSASVNDATNELTLDWDDVTDYDLTGYNVYIDDELPTFVDISQFVEIMDDGTYRIQVKSVDEGGLESPGSGNLLIIVGEAPPENLVADGNFDDHIALSWAAPGGGGSATEFRYDDDVVTGQLGFGANESAILGASHPVNGVLHSVSWFLTSNAAHAEAKIFIFGLDAAGVPDVNQVLHESALLPNTDDTWNDYELPAPVTAPNGFFIGVSTPGVFTAIGLDDGVGAPWEFQMGTQWGIADYTAGNDWLDVGAADFLQNFTIRGYGEAFDVLNIDYHTGDYRQSKEAYGELNYTPHPATDVTRVVEENANREITAYGVYRDGDLVATVTETNYDDAVAENELYFYEVTATYSNGESSVATDMVEARANMAPGMMADFSVNRPTDWSANFNWIDPEYNIDNSFCVDFEGVRVKKNGVDYAIIDPLEWSFGDIVTSAGTVVYEFSPFDEVPNYGPSIEVEVRYGPQPIGEDFESGQIPPEWTQSNPTVAWTVGTGPDMSSQYWTIPDNGSLVAAINDDAAGTGIDGNNMLITGAMDFGNSLDVSLLFDSFYDGLYGSMASVEYRIGANGTWFVLENILAFEDWTAVEVDLSLLGGLSDVYLGFHHDDAGGWAGGWAIDNVMFDGFNVHIFGDINDDSVVDILDLTRLIEIVTFTGEPVSPDELGFIDLNQDGSYNVLDVVVLIETILNMPGLAKDVPVVESISAAVNAVTLNNNREWQNIPVSVDYDGTIAGFQADLVFDPAVIELGVPVLASGNENVAVYTSLHENTMRVLAIDLTGGQIDLATGLLMDVPVQVIDENATGATDFAVEDLVLSGPGGVEIECECLVSVIDIGLPAPTDFSLMQNYPNPFNPTTNIRYDIAASGPVRLVIYNMLGQQVRTLVSELQNVGRYEVMWNGLNDAGQPIATGVYIYHLQAGDYSKTYKMAFIK